MNFLGFGQSAEVDIIFDGAENRKFAEVKTEDGKKEKYLLYYDGETVSGKVNVTLRKPGSKLEHQGIKIELVGQIELFYDRGNHYEFTSLVRELARPGDLIQNTSYPFEFANVEKPFEVYVGSNVRLRYFLRVTIIRRLSDIIREIDIAVHTLCSYPDMNSPIKMEVGIEDCLHIEFEYNKSKYHLKDVIVGKIYFLLVRIKIKHMEIAIIKRETTGSGANIFTENETIAKYEIMDGAPVKGESIPIRVFLAGYDLTPTMRDISKKFSVKYFLNLVLMDTEDRRYFKQQEITLWRKSDKSRKTQTQTGNNPHMPTHLVGGPDNMSSKHNMNRNTEDGVAVSTGDTVVGDTSPSGSLRNENVDSSMGLFTRESPPIESKNPTVEKCSTENNEPSISHIVGNAGFQSERRFDDSEVLFEPNNLYQGSPENAKICTNEDTLPTASATLLKSQNITAGSPLDLKKSEKESLADISNDERR
uniref:Vacuolar protein sorting-associated protein 26 n=1 Tax=Tabanus bromius TaxID=304241 RepID=A0A0K8TSB1_TABBR